MAHKLTLSKSITKNCSAASCKARIAELWKWRLVLKSCATSCTNHWNGSNKSTLFWKRQISQRACISQFLLGLVGFCPPVDFLAAFVCRVLCGALPALGSVFLVFELDGILVFACFVASSAIHFTRVPALLFLALIVFNSALVRVCFVRAMSVNSDGIDIILDSLLPFPLPLNTVGSHLYGRYTGLPRIIFSILISESRIRVRKFFSANCLEMVFLGSFCAIVAFLV